MARPREFDRNRALNAAMNTFWCNGFEASSVQDLLDAMEINRGSMYATFGDKQALFLEALEHYRHIEFNRLRDTLNTAQTPLDGIRVMLEGMVTQTVTDENRCGCFMNNTIIERASHDHQTMAVVQANRTSVRAALVQVIARGQADGNISRRAEADALTDYLMATIHGIRVMGKTTPNRETLTGVVEVALSALTP